MMEPLSSYAGCTLATVLKMAPLDPLENRILLCHALRLTRVQLVTQSERRLDQAESDALKALFARRLRGEPIAYIVGLREFYGLDFRVTPDVLIPRPDTELLVELAMERLPTGGALLDMGTGSGAIAVAIAHSRPDAVVTALDASTAALAIARENAAAHQTRVTLLESDWYGALAKDQRFAVIASNPPYIVEGDVHLSQGDLRFEPVDALTDHGDGLSDLRTIIDGAPAHLAPQGWLLMEHGYDQAAAVRELLAREGFEAVESRRDLGGHERISLGRRPC